MRSAHHRHTDTGESTTTSRAGSVSRGRRRARAAAHLQHDQQVGRRHQRHTRARVPQRTARRRTPIVAAPCVKAAMRTHPAHREVSKDSAAWAPSSSTRTRSPRRRTRARSVRLAIRDPGARTEWCLTTSARPAWRPSVAQGYRPAASARGTAVRRTPRSTASNRHCLGTSLRRELTVRPFPSRAGGQPDSQVVR
jgi:hypothetical protein